MHTKTAELYVGLHNALITASRDETIPAINTVEIQSDGKQLLLVSTDRYRLGVAHVKLDEGGGAWRFPLRVKDVETLVKSLKTVRRDAEWRSATIELAKDQRKLTVRINSGESFEFSSADTSFPTWRQMFPASGSQSAEAMTGFTAEYLASFGRVLSESTRMTLRHFGKDKPRVITVGDDYVGLIMPTRYSDEQPEWQQPEWFAEPKAKRAKKTA